MYTRSQDKKAITCLVCNREDTRYTWFSLSPGGSIQDFQQVNLTKKGRQTVKPFLLPFPLPNSPWHGPSFRSRSHSAFQIPSSLHLQVVTQILTKKLRFSDN